MNRRFLVAQLGCIAILATLAGSSASATHVSFSTGHDVELDGDCVVISPENATPARISPAGELTIAGQPVVVAEKDRLLLVRYNQTVHRIGEQAKEIGLQGAGLGFSAIGEAIGALFTGDSEAVEQRVKAKAEPLKQKARELCKEAQGLQKIQKQLATDVPEFRPYARMDDDEPRCDVDD